MFPVSENTIKRMEILFDITTIHEKFKMAAIWITNFIRIICINTWGKDDIISQTICCDSRNSIKDTTPLFDIILLITILC